MRSEKDVWARLRTIRSYYEAGWFEDPTHAMFGASELLWSLGFEEGSASAYFEYRLMYHEGMELHVHGQ